ncbi:FUSC family protein [Ruania halotolerans]|uniref:FUSC family protein n=1 Tax=Ruania halotolerans TaxID=2897773 RepID=UPI001E5C95F2|nr:aromatic acid exporter family protein [Ruania halotolerans]UFU06010.1 aromatic acid exporter family protein [Ruania halotolerans]
MSEESRPSPATGRSLVRRFVAFVSSPEVATDLLQIVKSVIAATAAWWVSLSVLDSQLPFLAPWTALLAVHATVYRSLSRGLQTTVASGVGVGLSFLIGALLEVNLWTFALAVLVGLVGSRLSWLRDEGVAIATTAIFVLSSGFDDQAPLLGDRLLEVGVGVVIGVAVNLLLLPPLRDQQAARHVDSVNRRTGEVLIQMADELEESWDTDSADQWVAETISIDAQLASAWQSVRFARESARINPRRYVPSSVRGRRQDDPEGTPGAEVGYEEILTRVSEGISHLRHMVRTVRESTYAESQWDDDFRREWVAIVRDAGRSIRDPEAEVEPINDRIDALAARASSGDGLPPGDLWPVYGSLLTSMRHIVVVVDDVASARQARDSSRSNPSA